MKSEPDSVTEWLTKLKAGQAQAADAIWKRYYPKLVLVASKRLALNPDRAVEGEDLVQSSFRNVCLAVLEGKYSQIENRTELWNLLFVATINRIRQHYRELNTQRRGRQTRHVSLWNDPSILADLRTPAAEAQVADLLEYLFNRLDQEDPTGGLRQIALLHLEEHSASSIAKILRRRKTTVLISLRLIRSLWEECALQ